MFVTNFIKTSIQKIIYHFANMVLNDNDYSLHQKSALIVHKWMLLMYDEEILKQLDTIYFYL